jgi:thioredoxin-dependent peroxiredoxin
MALTVGSKAPDFKTKDQDGKDVKLSDFKGRKVVLYFYPKDLTPGCTAEACSLRDNYKALQKAGYEVLGISSDNEKLHRKFIEKEKLPFRLLADEDKSVHALFGTWVEKSMYGRKYMGTARVTFIINENGIISEVIEKVDTKNHASQILGAAPSASKVTNMAIKKAAVKKIGKSKPAKAVLKKAKKALKKKK